MAVKPDPGTIIGRVRLVVREGILRYGSQNALGPALGVTQAAISRWMTEDSLDPKSSILGAISRVLGVNGNWLLTGQGDRYSLPPNGGDALRQAGFEQGIGAAESAVAALRTPPPPRMHEGSFEVGPKRGEGGKDRPA